MRRKGMQAAKGRSWERFVPVAFMGRSVLGRLIRATVLLGFAVLGLLPCWQAAPAFAFPERENQAILLLVPGLAWDMVTPQSAPHLYQMGETGAAANVVLPLRGGDQAGDRAIGLGGPDAADGQALPEAIAAAGGRVATISGRTDDGGLYEQYKALRKRANLLIIRPDDLLAMAADHNRMELSRFRQQYGERLAEIDRFVGKLLNETDLRRLLIVASPVSFADRGIGWKAAGIVLMHGGGVEPHSLLSSNSTRQPGWVALSDIPPTVLSYLGLTPYLKNGVGQVIGTLASPVSPRAYLAQQMETVVWLNRYRPFFVKGYAGAALVTLLLAAVFRLRGQRLPAWTAHMLTGLLAVPLIYLLAPAVGIRPGADMPGKVLLLAAAVCAGLALCRTFTTRLLALSVMTTLLIAFDLLRQGEWMKQSFLGYDLLAGARYYGIGNEYMGVLIGASMLAYFALRQQFPNRSRMVRTAGRLAFVGIVYLLAAPWLGTNAGGALAAAIAYGYVWATEQAAWTLREKWAWVAGGAAAALAGMLWLNTAPPAADQTHIGHMASLLLQGQFSDVWPMAWRKWTFNWWLLGVSVWGQLFAILLLLLLLDRFRPCLLRPAGEEQVAIAPSRAFLVAGMAAFLLNDSGVLAASGLMLFAAVPVLLHAAEAPAGAADPDIREEIAEEGTSVKRL